VMDAPPTGEPERRAETANHGARSPARLSLKPSVWLASPCQGFAFLGRHLGLAKLSQRPRRLFRVAGPLQKEASTKSPPRYSCRSKRRAGSPVKSEEGFRAAVGPAMSPRHVILSSCSSTRRLRQLSSLTAKQTPEKAAAPWRFEGLGIVARLK